MNRLVSNSWPTRRPTQAVIAQRPGYFPSREIYRSVAPSIAAIGRSFALLPSSLMLIMILVASSAICWAVIARSQSEFQSSYSQYGRMVSDIEAVRRSNATLQIEIRRLESEPTMIETAARRKLGMVKPTDIVVPRRVKSQSTDVAMLSVVR